MPKISTQDFLEFEQIRDGVILLKNRSLRSIMAVSSLNFALKSTEEQESIIYQFQSFLNSLDFPCQITAQSRRLNIIGYLDKIAEIGKNEKNDLLKIQIEEYVKFVESIVGRGTIMQKSFYVVVPFSLSEIGKAAPANEAKNKIIKNNVMTEDEFQRAKIQLMQRVEFVALGLRACGLTAVPLENVEVIELLWSLYHLQEAEKGYYPEIPPEFMEGTL
jgi:hypothetical protein